MGYLSRAKSKLDSRIKRNILRFAEIAEQTYHLQKSHYKLTRQIADNKEQLNKMMGRAGKKYVEITSDFRLCVDKQIDMTIEFDTTKIKKKLGKKVYNKVIDKEYKIVDLDGLIKLLKKHNVKPSEFKKFIETEERLNKDKLDAIIRDEEEELKVEDLDGCYKADIVENVSVKKA